MAKRVYAHNERLGDTVFPQAVTVIRQDYAAQLNETLGEDDIVDKAVCFGGSWLTRGHKSLVAIGSVIHVGTRLVIDAHVMSLFCSICSQTGSRVRKETPERYAQWQEHHIAKGECTINFEGTSRMMEVKAAEVLWRRFIARKKM